MEQKLPYCFQQQGQFAKIEHFKEDKLESVVQCTEIQTAF